MRIARSLTCCEKHFALSHERPCRCTEIESYRSMAPMCGSLLPEMILSLGVPPAVVDVVQDLLVFR